MPVINNIRKIRKEKGIKQLKMAEDLEVTRQTFTAIERNKYNPSLELALKIVKYFELPIDDVFMLEEDEKEKNFPMVSYVWWCRRFGWYDNRSNYQKG